MIVILGWRLGPYSICKKEGPRRKKNPSKMSVVIEIISKEVMKQENLFLSLPQDDQFLMPVVRCGNKRSILGCPGSSGKPLEPQVVPQMPRRIKRKMLPQSDGVFLVWKKICGDIRDKELGANRLFYWNFSFSATNKQKEFNLFT
ncbi:hypothetical protein NPIL_210181 [Nephila pilipes]|uniref:Uncharacterized protein n=1 Tax=Nephila pilipes TaxID=299642 RepID=A0A8X6U035_NEPPI|nr:hypothetical protein NPIL_210181 [Nephila pilipes]